MKKRYLITTLVFMLVISFVLTGCVGGKEEPEKRKEKR